MSSKITNPFPMNLDTNHLTNNLRYLMQKKGIDAGDLSKSTGIALTTINSLKRGVGNPTLSTMQAIAEFFQITIGQLTESALSDRNTRLNLVELALLDIQDVQIFLSGHSQFKSTISVEVEKNNQLFGVKINNNSLAPFFEKGTIFIVDPTLQSQDGDIVLVQFNNQLPCFRKIFMEEEACIFTPVSEIAGSEISKSKNFTIHGIVIKAIQNFYE